MLNLNVKQVLAITLAILSVLSGSTAQLTDLLGEGAAKTVISCASLAMSILSSILAVISSQGSLVKQVLAMPGIDKINVNGDANQTLASIAVDPLIDRISPTPSAEATVSATAKGVLK